MKIATFLITIAIIGIPIIIVIKKIIRKHRVNVIINNEYKKAKQEQKKDSE